MDRSSINPATQEMAVRQAAICSIFGNATRVLILWTLLDQELSVSEIAAAIQASLQATSQHLRLMEDKGLLASRRDGQKIFYSVVEHDLMEGCRLLLQARQLRSG
jgi:DNA-binding transcriptional ArsR family regulator